VQGSKRKELKAADPEKFEQLKKYLRKIYKVDEPWQPWATTTFTGAKVTRKPCWGCIKGCMRGDYKARDGSSGKFMCQSGIFYRMAAKGNYERPTIEEGYYANKLCDDYGLDTYVVEAAIRWLSRCYQEGILNDSDTDLPLSRMGSAEFIEALTHTISLRQGFGDVLAQGLAKAAEHLGQGSENFLEGLVSRADEKITYEPRMYITTGLLYAMEPRRPIHLIHQIAEPLGQWILCKVLKQGYFSTDVLRAVGKRFFGSELVFDFSTYEGKALAAKMIQDREYAKESLILCDVIWPIHQKEDPEDYVGDSSLESQILSAVTGMEVNEKDLIRIGERIWNLQRAILVKEGHNGRQSDTLPDYFFDTPLESVPENPKCLAPGKDGETISRQGTVVDRQKFEAMKDEYYSLRGWDETSGLQTKAKLDELDLADIAADLDQSNLIV
jgi:aldehyde:ferredoxin oxidoreductase